MEEPGIVAGIALRFTAWTERWVPDAFIFALLATLIVVVAAVAGTPTSLPQVVDAWGRGFWELIPFTLQMALIVITGHVLATSPPIGRVIRGIAREKLTETNPVFETMSIERKGGELVLNYGSHTNTCKLDGSASDVEGIDGTALKCRLSLQGSALVHRVDGSRGGRVNTFTIDESGHLTMKTRIHSKMMPADLRYTLTFAR